MDRAVWLLERRAAVMAQYDDEAPGYDDQPYPTTSHASFVDRLLATCPADGVVLDAPCGTGQFFARIRQAGRRVVGIDQSASMLEAARRKVLADRLEQVGLQEMVFDAEFDGAMTVDAMEHLPPEDWPIALSNLARAVRPGAHVYLTVEEVDDATVEEAYATARSLGLPTVRGEVIEGDTAGYHYYPGRERVRGWLSWLGLDIVAEGTDREAGWGYWHLLVKTRA